MVTRVEVSTALRAWVAAAGYEIGLVNGYPVLHAPHAPRWMISEGEEEMYQLTSQLGNGAERWHITADLPDIERFLAVQLSPRVHANRREGTLMLPVERRTPDPAFTVRDRDYRRWVYEGGWARAIFPQQDNPDHSVQFTHYAAMPLPELLDTLEIIARQPVGWGVAHQPVGGRHLVTV